MHYLLDSFSANKNYLIKTFSSLATYLLFGTSSIQRVQYCNARFPVHISFLEKVCEINILIYVMLKMSAPRLQCGKLKFL